ncbi:phakinin [Solea solea]|uniref:phakinin n=1 Tax=Solea solea TaxID=90069 RepID=UPI00272A1A16|nr:phakinin [Solea solea]
MSLSRHRSSSLRQSSTEHTPTASGGRFGSAATTGSVGTASTRGVFVASGLPVGGVSSLGTRVSRRALGISSVFLQGTRSSTTPVLTRIRDQAVGHGTAVGLNSCLMEYSDKVRALESLNQELQDQIRLSLDHKTDRATTWGQMRTEWKDIYRQVSEAILKNAHLMMQSENVQATAEDFKERYENEQPFRKEVEEEISSLYKVIDDANLMKEELQEQMENMREELRQQEQNHEQDVRVLYSQMSGHEVDQPDALITTSLDQILVHIRNHWEKMTERQRTETRDYQLCQEAESVSSRLSPVEQQLETLKAECHDTGCKIQSLQAETESVRALKRGLENSLSDARHWHDMELQNLGSVVAKLEVELADVHGEIEQQRRDYDTLLNNKQHLEQAIGIYHNIMDGEENRFHEAP